MLNERQKKRLRQLGHTLKPFILIGDKGVTDALIIECQSTIDHHELIKVRARGLDKAARQQVFDDVCEKTGATLIQLTGMTALLYKANPKQSKIDIGR